MLCDWEIWMKKIVRTTKIEQGSVQGSVQGSFAWARFRHSQ